MIDAVIFDLDGVLIDSEERWDAARREIAQRHGGQWRDGATEAMQGMSSPEWSAYLHHQLGVDQPPDQIAREVVERLLAEYEHDVPLLPGAAEAVQRLAARWPLGLASSANRPVIDLVLDRSGLAPFFEVTVSAEEVPRGKPAPDVYLDAAAWLGVAPPACAVVEDSANGIRSGAAAGMRVVAIPNRQFPPPAEILELADVVLTGLAELTPDAVQ